MLPKNYSSELYHYGVIGMKWGVRRTPEQLADNRTTKRLKRNVSAGYRNLKVKGKLAAEDELAYKSKHETLRKELSRPALSQRKKLERIEEAEREVTNAGAKHIKSQAEYKRAERIYDSDVSALKNHVNSMIEKYGEESVGRIKTKTVTIGNAYVKEKVKTGITLSNLPLIGTYTSGKYIGQRDYDDRRERIDREAERRY